ncbi:DUF1697 domain-containing protein [Cyclobacterium qasimii]|uniref:DUF1697 domain-containing protein n=2 Tax=Cyclobacterium qasimii TaxID=1350429 RepID=S7WUL8_9BACT|nr:DUF1697 domain-containing protein [Cyclobacterium qasimii]EPR67758.1 hypothetical protein ADICYQ_3184 [Cyclobacterium qasimii M12-11B]GEO20355.1 hypothetical protein CQA01_08890 [Cyclobacterium qasimii]
MEKKVAILRGINVGGKRKILMADLKSLFEDLGYKEVLTYIQSGNVIFTSENKTTEIEMADLIEQSIKSEFGFDVPVIVRTAQELNNTFKNNPYYGQADTDISKLHITFLNKEPEKENLEKIQALDFNPDKFAVEGKDIFIYCDGKYHQSKLTNNFFEGKLQTRATTRNLKTVAKLCELSQ